MRFKIALIIFFYSTWLGSSAFSQTEESVHWLSFERLDDSLKVRPGKVFIDFYADWCAPCVKMQKEVFTDQKIIALLNKEYYAVKMNVESIDTIFFGNQMFVNERQNRRNPVHQIPWLMARRKGKPFTLPALVFLNEKFEATARCFQYLNSDQMMEVLEAQ